MKLFASLVKSIYEYPKKQHQAFEHLKDLRKDQLAKLFSPDNNIQCKAVWVYVILAGDVAYRDSKKTYTLYNKIPYIQN